MGRRNGEARYHNRLLKSDPDDIDLAESVHDRFLNLCGTWERVKKEQLVPPPEMDGDMINWRRMIGQHRTGDFRHTEAEMQSLKAIAQWTVDMNCDLRNQPKKKINWKD